MDLFSAIDPVPVVHSGAHLLTPRDERPKASRLPSTIPLTSDEEAGIVLAVSSAFRKLMNLYGKIVPIFEDFGFTPPSAGVIARDLSEKIEKSIVQHCDSFTKGAGHCDLGRYGDDWEVKICKTSGLTINQSKIISGENYIVVNYSGNSVVKSVWVLWDARDEFFSPRKKNSNARSLNLTAAAGHIQTLYRAPKTRRASAC